WFKPTSYVADEGAAIRVRVPNALFRDWLTKHYAAVLMEALAEVDRKGVSVSFVTEEAPSEPVPPPSDPTPEPELTDDGTQTGGLAPRYSFDTFIVGPSNQFAHAACRAVAE